MTLKNKKLVAIHEYLDRLSSVYITDCDVLSGLLKDLNINKDDAVKLDWCLAHYKTHLLQLHTDIKNLQDRLRIADK